MKRIMVLGAPGAGKTVFSTKLGRALNIPVYHLDALMWNPKWREKPLREMETIQEEILSDDCWIIDGYYHKIAGRRFAMADTVIILDIPRLACLLRSLWRSMAKDRSDIAPGCGNKMDRGFFKYIWNYKDRQLKEIYKKAMSCEANVIVLKSSGEIGAFLTAVRNGINK